MHNGFYGDNIYVSKEVYEESLSSNTYSVEQLNTDGNEEDGVE